MRKITLVLLFIFFLAAGFYFFRSDLFFLYNNFGNNLSELKKIDFGNIITEVKKEVFAPSPLNVGGNPNQSTLVASKIIAQTNIQRFDNSMLVPLTENQILAKAAKAKADDMFKNQYFEHISPGGIDPGQLTKNAGYEYIVVGENLILGNFKNEAEVVQLWMNSKGHRDNILNERYSEIGVAIVKGTYKGQAVWIGVQEFGLPITSCQQPSQNLISQIEFNKNQLDLLVLKLDAKKEEIEKTNKRSSEYNQLVEEYNILVAEYNNLSDQTKIYIERYNSQINNFNACVEGN